MSKEARDFIYGTDLIDQHDYHDNDCGEGFLIPPSHLATILEAYHQERKKAASNNIEFFGQCRYGQFGCDFVCVRHIGEEVNDQINGGRYIEGLVNDLSAGDVGAMRAFDELLILEEMKIVNIERLHAGEPLTEINATHSPVNDVTTPPLKESGTGASACNRFGCNMDQGRSSIDKEQLNKRLNEWAEAKGLIEASDKTRKKH